MIIAVALQMIVVVKMLLIVHVEMLLSIDDALMTTTMTTMLKC